MSTLWTCTALSWKQGCTLKGTASPALKPLAWNGQIICSAKARHGVSHPFSSTYLRMESTSAAVRHNPDSSRFSQTGTESVSVPPSRDLKIQSQRSSPLTKPEESQLPAFQSLKDKVSDGTLRAITEKPLFLKQMTPVQAQVLQLLPELADPYNPSFTPGPDTPPRDLLVRAKTGTGKTLAFLVPAMEARLRAMEEHGQKVTADAGMSADKRLKERAKYSYARERAGTLIISPTRELATQIANEAMKLSRFHPGFEVRLLIGAESKRRQMSEWMRGRRDIVVGTPGRLVDLMTNEPEFAKGISKVQQIILDEGDQLLDMGFRPDLEAILSKIPPTPERQTFLFSATISPAIRQIARSALSPSHQFINCVSENSSPVHAHVSQFHTVLQSPAHQIPYVLRLIIHDQLANIGRSKIIVFFPTAKMTQLFATILRQLTARCLPSRHSTRVYEIHAKRSQDSRTRASDAFRKDISGASILVTSDVSARGVDYPGVTRVIQVGIPAGTEQYIHRIGRTGRAGTQGRGDLVLLPWEASFVSWQLSEVPLKPLTVDWLQSSLEDLVTKFDEDRTKFVQNARDELAKSFVESSRRPKLPSIQDTLKTFSSPIKPILGDIETNVSNVVKQVDPDVIRETFVAFLGFYASKTAELRKHKDEVIEGCRNWAVEAMKLSSPPYIPDAFLKRLGFFDKPTKPLKAAAFKFPKQPRALGRPWELRDRQRRSQRDGRYDRNDGRFGQEYERNENRPSKRWSLGQDQVITRHRDSRSKHY